MFLAQQRFSDLRGFCRPANFPHRRQRKINGVRRAVGGNNFP